MDLFSQEQAEYSGADIIVIPTLILHQAAIPAAIPTTHFERLRTLSSYAAEVRKVPFSL